MTSWAEVLAFWFGAPDDPGHRKKRDKWFGKDPAFDQEVHAAFSPLHQAAARGEVDHWQAEPQSCLALILVFDQFPRNMFRATARAFATDDRALALARHAVAAGFDREVPPVHRTFFYLPFEHSENLEDQRRAVELFRACEPSEGYERSLDYARRHMEIIARFGRFPHRNAVLGRENKPAETEFLKQPNSGF